MQVYTKASHSRKENTGFKHTVKVCIKFTFIMKFIPVVYFHHEVYSCDIWLTIFVATPSEQLWNCSHKWYLPRHFFFTLSSSSSLLAEMASKAPIFDSWQTNSSPIPLDAPVTQITLPRSSSSTKRIKTAFTHCQC